MSPFTLFFSVAIAHLLAVMSPGPDFAVVSRQTLLYGRRAGILTALGIATGLIAHVSWALFGLGWIVERWPGFLMALRTAGALFLLWIGFKAIRAQPAAINDLQATDDTPGHRHYLLGMFTNLLNAKALLFFTALCSVVITAATPIWLRASLGVWMIVSTAAWFSLVSFSLGHPKLRGAIQRHAHWIDRGMGAILLLLGAAMLLVPLFE